MGGIAKDRPRVDERRVRIRSRDALVILLSLLSVRTFGLERPESCLPSRPSVYWEANGVNFSLAAVNFKFIMDQLFHDAVRITRNIGRKASHFADSVFTNLIRIPRNDQRIPTTSFDLSRNELFALIVIVSQVRELTRSPWSPVAGLCVGAVVGPQVIKPLRVVDVQLNPAEWLAQVTNIFTVYRLYTSQFVTTSVPQLVVHAKELYQHLREVERGWGWRKALLAFLSVATLGPLIYGNLSV